jgi:hypothetical protein
LCPLESNNFDCRLGTEVHTILILVQLLLVVFAIRLRTTTIIAQNAPKITLICALSALTKFTRTGIKCLMPLTAMRLTPQTRQSSGVEFRD